MTLDKISRRLVGNTCEEVFVPKVEIRDMKGLEEFALNDLFVLVPQKRNVNVWVKKGILRIRKTPGVHQFLLGSNPGLRMILKEQKICGCIFYVTNESSEIVKALSIIIIYLFFFAAILSTTLFLFQIVAPDDMRFGVAADRDLSIMALGSLVGAFFIAILARLIGFLSWLPIRDLRNYISSIRVRSI